MNTMAIARATVRSSTLYEILYAVLKITEIIFKYAPQLKSKITVIDI